MQSDTVQVNSDLKDESQLVTFLLKDEEFGFDIMSVQKSFAFLSWRKSTHATYVDGIANLRGVVLPVIDMRTRFGMERTEETDRTRVLVVDIDGVKTGLRVDRVKQVARVLRSEMELPPAAIREPARTTLKVLLKLDNGQRIVMALNAAHVCDIGVARMTASSDDQLQVLVQPQAKKDQTSLRAPMRKSRRWSPFASQKKNLHFQWSMSAKFYACRLPTRFRRSRLCTGSSNSSRANSSGHRPAATAAATIAGR